MAVFRAQVVFPMRSALPADVITNTFHFQSLTLSTEAMADEWTARLALFYSGVYGGGLGMASYIAPPETFHVNWYNLSDPTPRVVDTRDLPLIGLNFPVTTIPSEVAMCLSFHGAATSGTVAARRRGRIYLGAINANWMTGQDVNRPPMFGQGIPEQVGESARANLMTPGDDESQWVVYSPTGAGYYPIVGGWVDNSPDTQRRRGVPANIRAVWPVAA